jgi:hypothetical protein
MYPAMLKLHQCLMGQYHHYNYQQAKWEKHLILDIVMFLAQNVRAVMARYTMMPVNHTIECFKLASIMFIKFAVTWKPPIIRTTTLALHDVTKFIISRTLV